MYHVLDPYYLFHYYKDGPYVENHTPYVHVIESDEDSYQIKEILASILKWSAWFKGADSIIEMNHLTALLEKQFNCKRIEKDLVSDELKKVLKQEEQHPQSIYTVNGHQWSYLCLHAIQSNGNSIDVKLWNKWLTDDIKTEIAACPRTTTKK